MELVQNSFAELEINYTNCMYNYNYFRSKLKSSTKLLILVKANSYGHGAVEFASVMEEAGADYFGVAHPIEGIELREGGIKTPIITLTSGTEQYRELVKYNLGILKSKKSNVKAFQGTALNLKRFADASFDMTLVFGPMYHLYTFEDKVKALTEAKRVTKPGGVILVAYCMNEYSILTYGFKENHIKESMKNGKVTESFHVHAETEDLYDYVRLEDIAAYNEAAGLERIQIVSADGPANYMRPILNAMDDETYELFIQYHLSTCERPDLMGASAHTLDILRRV